jgi:hypothetical protein
MTGRGKMAVRTGLIQMSVDIGEIVVARSVETNTGRLSLHA